MKKVLGKIYTGPKINKLLLNISSFYRLYVHYLYAFKILPAKVQIQEFTSEYYKDKRKNNMIFEEINFLARHKFETVVEIKEFEEKLNNKLPELKGKRENLWRKYKKVTATEAKENIKSDIDKITDEITTLYAQRNACSKRIIGKWYKPREAINKKLLDKIKKDNHLLI